MAAGFEIKVFCYVTLDLKHEGLFFSMVHATDHHTTKDHNLNLLDQG
jgi:hypothetical protein